MSAKSPECPIVENVSENVTFTPRELKFAVLEIADRYTAGKPISVRKIIHNAKYFAKIEMDFKNVEAEKNCVLFTDDEWEKFATDVNYRNEFINLWRQRKQSCGEGHYE